MNSFVVSIRCDHCAGEGEIRYRVVPEKSGRAKDDWDIGKVVNENVGDTVAFEDMNVHDKELIRAVFAEQPDDENSGVCKRCCGASCEHI